MRFVCGLTSCAPAVRSAPYRVSPQHPRFRAATASLGIECRRPDLFGNEGGIWMDGGGLAADAAGNIYLLTGSGEFNPAQRSYADAALKLTRSLRLADYFAPTNTTYLDSKDQDVGSGGVLLAPKAPGSTFSVLIGGGKFGTLFVIDTANMGHQRARNAHVQGIPNPSFKIFSTPAYYNGMVYTPPSATCSGSINWRMDESPDSLPSRIRPTRIPARPPASRPTARPTAFSGTSTTPARAMHRARLCYTPTTRWTSARSFTTAQQPARADQAGTAVKFAIPTIANGKVYVGTQTGLTVYGLID